MYELVMKLAVAVMAVMGLVMAIAPKAVAKKSIQESKSGLIFVRILGAVIAVGSIVALLMLFGIIGF